MNNRELHRQQIEIGSIIVEQMGGSRLIRLMTGAKISVGPMPWRDSVRAGAEISLPYPANDDINRVVVTYDEGRDLYSMQGFSDAEEKETFDSVYCDQLMDLFEAMTHLYLTLTPRRPMVWGGLVPESNSGTNAGIPPIKAKRGE